MQWTDKFAYKDVCDRADYDAYALAYFKHVYDDYPFLWLGESFPYAWERGRLFGAYEGDTPDTYLVHRFSPLHQYIDVPITISTSEPKFWGSMIEGWDGRPLYVVPVDAADRAIKAFVAAWKAERARRLEEERKAREARRTAIAMCWAKGALAALPLDLFELVRHYYSI